MTDERAGLPLVAVVGRPNVGKSTLVNRLVGGREAIVEEHPGVTRDRKEFVTDWSGRAFRVVDTGGWLSERDARLTSDTPGLVRLVSEQAERAMRDADVVLLLVDAVVGVTDEDERVAAVLRRGHAPVVVVANKVDDDRRLGDVWAFARLGLGDAFPVSAIHGRGSGDLLDAVVAALPDPEVPPPGDDGAAPDDPAFAVAIVGRPNVGKSTLFNRLVGEERAVVHETPGTTRDAVDTVVETAAGRLRFVDTAGMRRRSRMDETAEHVGALRALQAIDRADAALLVIDAAQGVTHQDQRLAERVDAAGTAVVIVLNKWDLLDTEARETVRTDVADRLAFLAYAPVLAVSAQRGTSVHRLIPALREAKDAYRARIPTAALNRVVRDAQQRHPPPVVRNHRPRILYATQGATDPPTFVLFATRSLPAPYLRYLERMLREAFDLGPTPVKIRVRRRVD